MHNLTRFVSFASMGILIVVGVIAFIIWASSNNTHDHHVYTPPVAKKPLSVDEWNMVMKESGMSHLVHAKVPVPVPTEPVSIVDPDKGVWNTSGIKVPIPAATCVAQYNMGTGSMESKEEATSWYIDERVHSNQVSPAEKLIQDALNEFNVEWVGEVSFKNLIMPTGGCGRFDFYIPSLNLLIEYNSKQWHSTPDAITKDHIKADYCKKWGIELIVLNEKHYYNIEYHISGILKNRGISRK